MNEARKRIAGAVSMWREFAIILVSCVALSGALAGQDLAPAISLPAPQLPAAFGARLKAQLASPYEGKTSNPQLTDAARTAALSSNDSESFRTPTGARIITLQQAQQKAASASNNPLMRLGELQVEVAKQTRLGTQASFFPQIGSTFENFHFNKFLGERLQITGPLGGQRTFGLPLFGKDQTLAAVTATQPITPLLQLRQLYRINLADERIARAKAGMPVAETASKVEKAFYELLVAQRRLALARGKATETGNKWLVASNSAVPVAPGGHDEDLIETSNALAIASARVKELTASLNDLLGWPDDTELQLLPPDPRFEEISLKEATEKALAANPEVIEAEQNVVKARAASTIQKLSYVPVVAAMGGYAYNSNVMPLLPRDFSFIGIVATYNLFDFGKREHTIKGARAQSEMAEIALQLTKAKVAAAVKSSHFELERSRQLSELTRRLESAIRLQRTAYGEGGAELVAAKKAKVEAEMFQADLEYRQALTRLKRLMGE